MTGRVDLSDFVAGFLLEAEEHLHTANQNLVLVSDALKKGTPEPKAVRELFRSLHTIKGLAAMVGAEPIVDISHEMEGLLRTADRDGGKISEPILNLLAEGARAVEERVRGISLSGIQKISSAPAKLIEAMALAQKRDQPLRRETSTSLELPAEIEKAMSLSDREVMNQASRAQRRIILIDFQPSPQRAAAGLNITSLRERLAQVAELIKVVPRSLATAPTGISFSLLIATDRPNAEISELSGGAELVEMNTVQTQPAVPAMPDDFGPSDEPTEWIPTEQSSIRVDVRRLDEALEQLSGLFVTRFKLERVANQMALQNIDTRELRAVIAESSRQLRRLRTAISESRMVPMAELLQRLPLVVRGITKDSQKSVNLNISAGTAEVDKAVADKIFPAIIHLIRNAVDHAIETRHERKKLNKPETGELQIICDDSSGTNLVVTIVDDGRGIDREAVAKKAQAAVATTDEELLRQICKAGLSTSAAITHTSGRGMGMDIVKRSVELLGGALSLQTRAGEGTTITLRVPVSITIVDVLSFVAGTQSFVTPVAIVEEIIEIAKDSIVELPNQNRGHRGAKLIQHRGRTIPLFILDSLLQNYSAGAIPSKALIVSREGGLIAFGIDRMIGKQEAVVRPLDDALVRNKGMAGATDLGDGKPTLVLDLASLGTFAMENKTELEVQP